MLVYSFYIRIMINRVYRLKQYSNNKNYTVYPKLNLLNNNPNLAYMIKYYVTCHLKYKVYPCVLM